MGLDIKDTFNMSDNIKSTCELMVEDTVDSKDNLEEDTMKLLKSECITLIGIFFNLDVICLGDSGCISLTCWTTLRT